MGRGVAQVVEGPVRPKRRVRPTEYRAHRRVVERPVRAAQGQPQRRRPDPRAAGDALAVELQPDERVRRGRQPLQRAAALSVHADQLLADVHPVAGHPEQLRGARPGRDVEREDRPVPVAPHRSEQRVEVSVADVGRQALGQLRLEVRPPARGERLQRVVMGIGPLAVPAVSLGHRVEQRAAPLEAMELVEAAHDRPVVPAGARRIEDPSARLAGDPVHRSRHAVAAAATSGLSGRGEPEHEVPGLGAPGAVPGHLDSPQEPIPAQ